jgi:hypothetical protein
VVLNKQEKEQLVVKLYQEGKPIREIAQQAHLSFGTIGKIIRRINSREGEIMPNDLSGKSKETQALSLFLQGKRPVDVAIELDLSSNEVENILQEFWALNQLHELAFAYSEIKTFLPSFLKLFHLLKDRKMLNEKYLLEFLKYVGQDIPELTYRLQQLANEVIDLESKKRQSIDALAQLSDTLSWYHRNIKLSKQILSESDKKINQKQCALNEKPASH